VRWWRHARAGLIALAIALGVADGCPLPRNGTERRVAEQRMGKDLAGAVAKLERFRTRLLRPVQPAAGLFGLRQRWKLFAGAARRRYRMSIEVRAHGETTWRVVYRPHDDEHELLAGPITYRRVRGAWNPHSTYGARGGYAPFATWIADEIFARDARAEAVRVQMEKVLIGPHGGYRGTGEQVYPRMITRMDREAAHARRTLVRMAMERLVPSAARAARAAATSAATKATTTTPAITNTTTSTSTTTTTSTGSAPSGAGPRGSEGEE
jgi:hypothetical protein